MRSASSIIVFSTFLILTPSLFAADPNISVQAEVDQAFITIGDRVNFRVTASHDHDVKILDYEGEDALRDFEVKSVGDFSYEEAGLIHVGKNFVITNYELGDYVIRPFVIEYRIGSGPVQKIQTNQLYVSVQSIDNEKDPDSDIRGVKGTIRVRGPLWPWILILLILLGVSGFIIWRFLRKKQLEAALQPKEVLNPHEEAYRALNRLKHTDYLKKNQYKLYFSEMSEILRHYFERRYTIPALESTTFELMRDLKPKTSPENRKLIERVLVLCDAVKFAKFIPEVPQVLAQNKEATTIIDVSRLVPEEPPQATGPSSATETRQTVT